MLNPLISLKRVSFGLGRDSYEMALVRGVPGRGLLLVQRSHTSSPLPLRVLEWCSSAVTKSRWGDVRLIVKSYLMYDQIPASLYRKFMVETDGKKYRLRVSEGEVSQNPPYEHVEMNRHSRLYGGENEAKEAAESLFRKFESVGWLLGGS
jgi:hypothetical protein